jgi:hypothetical protein
MNKDMPTRLTPLMMAGKIAATFPHLDEDERLTLDRLFSTPESTEATLRHLAAGPGSDHLPDLRGLERIGRPTVSEGTFAIMNNFAKASERLGDAELARLGEILANREKARIALVQTVRAAKTKA